MFSPQKTTLKKLFLVTNYKLSQSNKLRLFYSIAIAIAMTMTNTVAIELLKELNAATKIFYAKNVELKKENSLLEIECSTLKNELEHKVRIEEKESIQKQKDLEYANSNKFSQNLLDHVKSAKEEFEKEEFEKVEASNTQSRKKSETEMTTVALDTKKILEMLSQE